MRSATAAADPLDEPPGVCAGLCGLVVGPGKHAGELGGDGLAEDHGAGRAHERDAGGVAGRRDGRGRSASPSRSAGRRCR